MTDKGMPEKIEFACDAGGDYLGSAWREGVVDRATPYIRSDIVEELVRAASVAVSSYYSEDGVFLSGMGEMDDILSRINAIMDGK